MFEETSKIAGQKRISSGKIKTRQSDSCDQYDPRRGCSSKELASSDDFWFGSGEPCVFAGNSFGPSSSLGAFWPSENKTLEDNLDFRAETELFDSPQRPSSPGVSDPSCGGCDSETHCTDACSPPCSGDESCTAVNPCFDPSCMGEPCFKKRCATPNCVERDCPDNHCSESICFNEPCPSQFDAIPCDFEHVGPFENSSAIPPQSRLQPQNTDFANIDMTQTRDDSFMTTQAQRDWQINDTNFTSSNFSQLPWSLGSTEQQDTPRQLISFPHTSTSTTHLDFGQPNISSVTTQFPRTNNDFHPLPQYDDALLLSNFYDTNHASQPSRPYNTTHALNNQHGFVISPPFSGYESSPATPQLSEQMMSPVNPTAFSMGTQHTRYPIQNNSRESSTWDNSVNNSVDSKKNLESQGTQTQPLLSAGPSTSAKTTHICQWIISEADEDHTLCLQKFGSEDTLQMHVKEYHIKHKNSGPFCCLWDGCNSSKDKDFGSKSKLGRHVQIHTGNKPFVCSVPDCGQSFGTKQTLQNHENTHTGEKPYACWFTGCTFRATTKNATKCHYVSQHEKKKQYKCELCGFECSDSSNMSKHKKTHDQVRLYTCPHSGCAFRGDSRWGNVMRHFKTSGHCPELLENGSAAQREYKRMSETRK